MKKKWAITCFAGIFFVQGILAQTKIVLDPTNAKDVISKNIYGHFAEHLGHCIYGGFYVGDSNTKIPKVLWQALRRYSRLFHFLTNELFFIVGWLSGLRCRLRFHIAWFRWLWFHLPHHIRNIYYRRHIILEA